MEVLPRPAFGTEAPGNLCATLQPYVLSSSGINQPCLAPLPEILSPACGSLDLDQRTVDNTCLSQHYTVHVHQ